MWWPSPDKGAGEKTALNIVEDLVEGKELLYLPHPHDPGQGEAGRLL